MQLAHGVRGLAQTTNKDFPTAYSDTQDFDEHRKFLTPSLSLSGACKLVASLCRQQQTGGRGIDLNFLAQAVDVRFQRVG